ncbi:MAG: hypothetical protein ACO1RX_20590 [Candidatus Sericytochromatia bacterium]
MLVKDTCRMMCCGLLLWAWPAQAWDSQSGNPTHATHSYFTEWALARLAPEHEMLRRYGPILIEGANSELHELPVSGQRYGLELNALRLKHRGTNAGCDDMRGWWQDAQQAWRQGKREQAFFQLGVMLHMIQDMGVPAHALGHEHQGSLLAFDRFELLGLFNWKPQFAGAGRSDPHLPPWGYYAYAQAWTLADAPDYRSADFARTWWFASAAERDLLRRRQGRTALLSFWALRSAWQVWEPLLTRRGAADFTL